MTREQSLELFEGDAVLCEAAVKWWEEVESCKHPYARLWFRHWRQESRARPQIARAFQQAFELGLTDEQSSARYLVCELFGRLYHACVERRASERAMGLSSGPLVSQNDADMLSVTFIEVDLPDSAFDFEIEEAVKTAVMRKSEFGALAITWLTPFDDIPGQLRQNTTDIGFIRDKLGLAHWQKAESKIALLWPPAVTAVAHVWLPSPEGRSLAHRSGWPMGVFCAGS